MFNPFQQLGDLKKLRDQAMEVQKALQQEQITVEKHGVVVVMTGDQKVVTLSTNGKSDSDIADCFNEAIKKSQEVAAKKLAQMGGGLGGMLGR